MGATDESREGFSRRRVRQRAGFKRRRESRSGDAPETGRDRDQGQDKARGGREEVERRRKDRQGPGRESRTAARRGVKVMVKLHATTGWAEALKTGASRLVPSVARPPSNLDERCRLGASCLTKRLTTSIRDQPGHGQSGPLPRPSHSIGLTTAFARASSRPSRGSAEAAASRARASMCRRRPHRSCSTCS